MHSSLQVVEYEKKVIINCEYLSIIYTINLKLCPEMELQEL